MGSVPLQSDGWLSSYRVSVSRLFTALQVNVTHLKPLVCVCARLRWPGIAYRRHISHDQGQLRGGGDGITTSPPRESLRPTSTTKLRTAFVLPPLVSRSDSRTPCNLRDADLRHGRKVYTRGRIMPLLRKPVLFVFACPRPASAEREWRDAAVRWPKL